MDDAARQASLKEVQKHSKILLGRLSHGNGCMKALLLIGITVAVGAAFVSKDLQSLDLKKLLAVVSKDLQSLDLKKLLADLNLA